MNDKKYLNKKFKEFEENQKNKTNVKIKFYQLMIQKIILSYKKGAISKNRMYNLKTILEREYLYNNELVELY